MVIDLDVRNAAGLFATSQNFMELIQSVVNAEGDILRAVNCTYPHIETRREALHVVCRSAVHAMADYIRAHDGRPFVQFWGDRWAPLGVANDPRNLNANWAPNVSALWKV